MAIIKCKNNLHFYDDGRYDECPHCKSMILSDDGTQTMTVREKDRSEEVLESVNILRQKIHLEDVVDKDKTIAYRANEKNEDFVTGWLVCVEGPERGRDYRLFHGVNRIGRSAGEDISIVEDMTISRTSMCSVVYDIRGNDFYLVPEAGSMVYLNGKHISSPEGIKTGDIIKLGKSAFEYIAFCRDSRKWE